MRYLLVMCGVLFTSTCLQGCSSQKPEPQKGVGDIDIFGDDHDRDRDRDRHYDHDRDHDRYDNNGW